MDLYTSLVRLKMQMNDGRVPSMTPVPESSLGLIDPAFTIGYGALTEDAEMGLRCPVRECGKYFHVLSLHLNTFHRGQGGAKAVRAALDIPPSVALCSQAHSAKKRAYVATRTDDWRSGRKDVWQLNVGKRYKHASRRTMAARNLQNVCESQMKHALIDLQNRLGRSPGNREVATLLPNGSRILTEMIVVYGSFDNAKAQLGLDTFRNRVTMAVRRGQLIEAKEMVLDALREWYGVHGTLPSQYAAEKPSRTPLIPNYKTIMRAMGTDSWPEAMRRAASRLNIYGGRYGLPESVRPVEAA